MVRDFKRAWESKDIKALMGLLDPEATVIADGGGLVAAALHPIHGREEIGAYWAELASRVPPSGVTMLERTVNGQPGLVMQQDGVTITVFAFGITGDQITLSAYPDGEGLTTTLTIPADATVTITAAPTPQDVSLWRHRITGTPENCRRLLEDEEAILVFPEGAKGISKPFTQRYQLQEFGNGFLRLALETGAPIVPIGFGGIDGALAAAFKLKRPPVSILLL